MPFFEDETRTDMDFSDYFFFLAPQRKHEPETPQEISTLNGYEGYPIAKNDLSKKQTGLNILILAFLSIMAGWFGIVINHWTGQTNLALAVFIAIPPLGVLVLSFIHKNRNIHPGLEFNFRHHGMAYLFSLLLFPLLAFVIVLMGSLTGLISIDGLLNKGISSFVEAVILLFFSDFIKNCLEEYTWRGFFTQHFKILGIPDLLNHLSTGIIWALWHLPYWLFLLNQPSAAVYSTQSTTIFILLASLFLIASSFVFGEIRLLTKSIWPVVLLHSSLTAITITLLLKGFVTVQPSAEVWLSPGGNSIVFILMLVMVGLGLYRARLKKNPVNS